MNRSNYFLSSLLGLAFIFTSCSPTLSPFTQSLYEDNNWTEDELRQIQFYLSNDIVLYRELNKGKSEIIEGEIKVVDGKQRDQITFNNGTPGVFMFSPKTNRFAVSFEDGGDDRFLIFGPSPKASNRYVLMASDWSKHRGVVTYAGQKWSVDANSAFSALLVDLKRLHSVDVNTRVASGRKVGG